MMTYLSHMASHDQLTGLPGRTLLRERIKRGALATPAATFATLFDFLGLPHWPALLAEVADMGERQFGVTDLSRSEGLLSFATIQRLLPEALAAAEAALRDTPPDLARLKRLGPMF